LYSNNSNHASKADLVKSQDRGFTGKSHTNYDKNGTLRISGVSAHDQTGGGSAISQSTEGELD